MKIRAITIGISVSSDLQSADGFDEFAQRIALTSSCLYECKQDLEKLGYTVQTLRIALNPLEDWITTTKYNAESIVSVVSRIDALVQSVGIDFCSIGAVTLSEYYSFIPPIIAQTKTISASIWFPVDTGIIGDSPDTQLCVEAATVCCNIARLCGDVGNFRFSVGFSMKNDTPFFPVASHETGRPPTLTIGLENGDLIFLAGFAATSLSNARDNLYSILFQTLPSIESCAISTCGRHGVEFGGTDVSVNPGLTPQDSVGAGVEHMLGLIPLSASGESSVTLPAATLGRPFGSFGTLGVVSAITGALKLLAQPPARCMLAGYSGLMLPVMEDLVLAARAAENPPRYTIRELLLFSSVCGVGIDTVPIPGDSTPEDIAALYLEVGTLATRLNKPLSCRLLPMKGLSAGDLTQVDSPFLCNTRVFSLKAGLQI